MNKGKLTKNIKQVFVALLCLAVVFLFILPFLWIFATSMRPSRESFALPPSFWPARLDFTNYRAVLNTIPFFHYAFNSMTIAVLSTLGMTLFTSMAAFGLSRLQLRFSGAIYSVFLAGMMVPASAMLVPVFTIIRSIGLLDSKWALILLGMYYPVGLLMMRQTMMTIPKSYDEAAYIDGAGSFRIYWQIILPMSRSSVMVSAVMCFIAIWNNFLQPLILLNSTESYTLPLAMQFLKTSRGNTNMALVLAAVMLTLIPPLLIYIFAQKYLIQGVLTSGLKA